MNIFVTSDCYMTCAKELCDKHVVKMILESGQMLSTAHRLCNGFQDNVYKTAYKNHPCTIWTRRTSDNYIWHYNLWLCMCHEYKFRYNKIHTTYTKLVDYLCYIPKGIPFYKMTSFPCCMPDEYKIYDCVHANYRHFICNKPFKRVWTKTAEPLWHKNN